MAWRTGAVHRERVVPIFMGLAPQTIVRCIGDISPQDLVAQGVQLVLLDVDNTLVLWRSHDIPPTTTAWLQKVREAGLEICLLSNTKNPARLQELSQEMKVHALRGKFKPSTQMYREALQKFGKSPQQAVMIGDQLFTDVWGANRSGIPALWVEQMGQREFAGTKISRLGERLVRPWLYRAMDEPTPPTGEEPIEDLHVGGSAAFDLMGHPVVRQFVKFAVVGGVSTVIDLGLHYFFMFKMPAGQGLASDALGQSLLKWNPALFTPIATRPTGEVVASLAASPLFKVVSAGIAIFNSFLWNRAWTFRIQGSEHRTVQLGKFYVVAIIGLVLNAIIVTILSNVVPGHAKLSWGVGSGAAVIVVSFWNFFGQKLWTFRKH